MNWFLQIQRSWTKYNYIFFPSYFYDVERFAESSSGLLTDVKETVRQ